MAHKKSLLTKYLSGNESNSDCRSPRHDGRAWFIPETSLSGPSEPENRNAIPVNPGTCSNAHETINQVDTNVPNHLVKKKKIPHLNLTTSKNTTKYLQIRKTNL